MDVRCDRCHSEYEFDESRIPAEGLPVKCSSCNHVFRVYPPGAENLPGPGSTAEWLVRQPSGNVFRFRELTTLQRWIVERKVTRHDEISKTGRQWKRLGDVAELATFFQVVEAAQPALAAGWPPQAPAPVAQPGMPGPAMAPQPGAPLQGLLPQPGVIPGVTAQQVVPPQPAPRPTGPQPQMPVPGVAPGAAWEQVPQQVPWQQPSGNWQLQQTAPGGPAPEEEDYPGRRGGKAKWVILVVLLLLAGSAGTAYVVKPELFKSFLGGGIDELAVNHVKAGYQELLRDSYASIDRAIDNFDKAIALANDFSEAKAGLAEAELARAEYLLEEADDLAAGLDRLTGPDLDRAKADLEAKRREAALRSERAFTVAKEALSGDPSSVAANRAMADYYRFKNAPEQMKPLVEKARAASPNDAGVAYVLGSSVGTDAAAADRAVRYFDQALEAAPQMQRARYKLARAYLTQGDKDKAKMQVEAILRDVPDHERAKALLLVISPPPPAPAPTPSEPPPVPEEKKLTFDQLLSQAERLRNSDRAGKALKLYEQAQEMEPEDPDVFVGIGWCYVDLEEPAAAISSFKTALRFAPRLSDAHMGLAEAYRVNGDKANAVKHYKAFLDIIPSGEDAEVARRMIETLK